MSTPPPGEGPQEPRPGQPPDDGVGWGQAPDAPSYGSPGPTPSGGPPSYGQYGDPGQAPSFAVSQPGIIPLRPLTLGEIYDGSFKAIRANPGVMFGLAAVVVAVASLIQGVATWGLFEQYTELLGSTNPQMQDLDELYGAMTASLVPSVISAVVTFVITTVLNGVLIHSVSQSVLGRRLPLGELWSLVRPQLLKLLGLTFLIGLLAMLVTAIAFVPLIASLASSDVGLILGMALLSLLLMVVGLVFVTTVTVLATPSLVLERSSPITALRRSWQLTRPTFWRVAGIYLLTQLLVVIVSYVVAIPVTTLTQLVAGMNGTALQVATLVSSTVAAAATTPFVASVVALLYIDIRIRREGLDLELAAAAEAG